MSRWWAEPVTLIAGPLPDWQQLLAERALPRGTRVCAVLRDEQVHYRVVPWHAKLNSPAARQALAQQAFVDAFGAPAQSWLVQIDTPRFGAASLACAVVPAVRDAVLALLHEAGLRVVALRPLLMQVFNHHRRALQAADFSLLLQHGAGLTLLLVRAGQPVHVKQLPGLLAAQPSDWALMLAREQLAMGLDEVPGPVWLADVRAVGSAAGGAAAGSLENLPALALPQKSRYESRLAA